jgi:hypothetical protein
MSDRQIKIPGPDHPIEIESSPSRVVVTAGGKVIADTVEALTLREAGYAAVQYIPRRDVDMTALARSDHHLLPLQGRGVVLQHPDRRGAFDECGVDVRDAFPGDGGDQELRRLLPRPCRRDPMMGEANGTYRLALRDGRGERWGAIR